MRSNKFTSGRRTQALVLTAAAAVFAFAFGLFGETSTANSDTSKQGLFVSTTTHDEELPNYDIRTDKSAFETITAFRNAAGANAIAVANIRDEFVRGEDQLRTIVPTLKIVYNEDIRIPEVIAPDVKKGTAFLTPPSAGNRAETLRAFVRQNAELVGATATQIDDLQVTADYTNPDGNLSFAHLEQLINGIPVFRGEVKAGFTKRGEIIRVINNLAPGLDYSSLSADFHDPADAVRAAAANIKHTLRTWETIPNAAASTDIKVVFGEGDWATTAEKMYFPTEPGVARAAWRVLIWQPVSAYYVIVDAETGTMLWRKNIGEDQTQAATYEVYTNPNAMINIADNPAPMTPGPISPGSIQGSLATRSTVTLIGNEGPNSFNNNGWITDGDNITDGNANEAGLDRVAPDGVDAPMPGDGSCPGAGCRVFSSTWNPPPGNPTPGDNPLTAPAQRGAVIMMFYAMNLYHDELYRLGFTEQARNFQHDNFGRGGIGGDRVRSEGQDSGGTNNANFNTPADGGRGRMQMYLWTGPNPDYDGTTDIDIVIHEVTHGTSNRLHGNASGLSTNMSRGMGEGWSDFYGHALLSEPSDPIEGIYTTGGYATYLRFSGYTQNYYYGIRRFPKAVMEFTGGPNNLPHNPLTFADIDGSQINLNDGAFSRGPFGGSTADQTHNAGEVWSSALWEVRAKFIRRLGWEVGNRRILQYVTDGMKLAPLGPTFLTERDAIIAAAQASGTGADVADVWAGFAIRGMGYSASIQNPGNGTNNARVTEAFDLPNLFQTPAFTVSDPAGDGDGFPEPGETVSIAIPLTNETGNTATGVTLQIVGGGSADYGTIAHGETVTRNVSFTVPVSTPCGETLELTLNVTSSIGPTSFTRDLTIGELVETFTEDFDGVTAPSFPSGWTATAIAGGLNFVTSSTGPGSAPNSAFAQEPLTIGGGTDLTSPPISINTQSATISFRHNFETEAGWDGGLLEIKIGNGAFQDIITAGGTFIENGYNSILGGNGVNNPIAGRSAWSGDSGGYITTSVRLPASAAGQDVQFRWRFGSDDNTAVRGWNIDDVSVIGNITCSVNPPTSEPARADFDGDGRTDVSVFRGSEGNWYLNQSTDGFAGINFGLASDVLTPGDFDGDGKADVAVFRADASGTAPDFYVLKSSDFTVFGASWGTTGDVPVTGDYDGDGSDDFAVYRDSDQTWYILTQTGSTIFTPYGEAGDTPAPADYDGDGTTDLSVHGGGSWSGILSGGGVFDVSFGSAGDVHVPGDYDGDGSTDLAVYRPSDGTWYIINSGNGTTSAIPFGISTDVPVPGDYDGDGSEDVAVYRDGIWWILGSTDGVSAVAFGISTDDPIVAAARP